MAWPIQSGDALAWRVRDGIGPAIHVLGPGDEWLGPEVMSGPGASGWLTSSGRSDELRGVRD